MLRHALFFGLLLAGCSAATGRSEPLADAIADDCSTLDEVACAAREDCLYVVDDDGFPGPIGFCTTVTDACIQWVDAPDGSCDPACVDLDPDCVATDEDPRWVDGPLLSCESLDQDECTTRPDCEYFTDPSGFPGPVSFCRARP